MPYNLLRQQYPIKFWIHLMTTDLEFPEWQRENCWTQQFEKDLILSILDGVDLPKLYIGDIKGSALKYIIDGGHRSRTIKRFHDNEFPVTIDDQDIFYSKPSKTRNTGCLTDDMRSTFDDYHLDVVVYKDISTNECRKIFNILQNAQPMSIYDVVNSYQSDLVDWVRALIDFDIDGTTIMEHFDKFKFIQKPDKTKVMTKLICWFSILFPVIRGDDDVEEDVSLKYLQEGNNKNSPCLSYVKGYNNVIDDDDKLKFINLLTFIFDYCNTNQVAPTDLNTLIHAKVNHHNFSMDNYNNFLQEVAIYENLKKQAENLHTDKRYDESAVINKQADDLNESYNKDLHIWFNSRKSGGNNPSGMRKRYGIVKDRCL